MWIGIVLMPIRIRIGIKMDIWIRIGTKMEIWIRIGIKTMPINNTEFYNIKENANLRKKEIFRKQYTITKDVFT